MAFTPPYYSNYNNNFSNGFCEFPSPVAAGDGGGLKMWCQENLLFFDNIGVAAGYMVPSESDISSSSVSTMPFPEAESHGAWNMTVLPEFNMGFAAGNQQQEVCGLGEESSPFVSNVCPNYPAATNSWEIQGKPAVQETEEQAMKIGRYSVEERKDRILRYLKKRNQRNFNKTIKYACRKTLADKRVRVRGRFAKNNEASEDETAMKNNNNLHQDSFYSDAFQIKHDDDDDDEDWLEAVASFMYLPYISG